ncbi:MAG TPA: hypothetical protein DHV48_07705 [Prolixibacteraceae bacterium]|nr:hypothetical protein [Prolixibacteraceae bacterium]
MVIISLLFLNFNRCTQAPTDVSSEIKELNNVFMEAFNSGDIKTMAGNYTSNAKLFPANSDAIEGPEAIVGFWTAVKGMGIKRVQLETVIAEKTGNIAIEEGRYKLFVDGDQMADQGKFIVTWEKVNGQWKIARDIWNTNNPAPVARATENGTIYIVHNFVKADKIAQFEDFNLNYLKPAAEEFAPELKKTVRFLKQSEPNEDGTFSYFFLMDPAIDNADYGMAPILTSKYGKEKADEYMKMYSDCLKKHTLNVAVQTGW